MPKIRRPRTRVELQAEFIRAMSPRPVRPVPAAPVESEMIATPIMAGDTAIGTFVTGMSHEEFMAGMGWGSVEEHGVLA